MMARLDSKVRMVAGSRRSRSRASALRSSAIASSWGDSEGPFGDAAPREAGSARGGGEVPRSGADMVPDSGAPASEGTGAVAGRLGFFKSPNTAPPETRATARHAATSWGIENENRRPRAKYGSAPRPGELGLGCAGRDPQHARDLPVLVALHVVQHENNSRPLGKHLDRALEIHFQIRAPRLGGEGIKGSIIFAEALLLRPEGRPARQDDVDGEPVKPRSECRFPPEGPELLPGSQENVLGDIRGRFARRHPTCQIEDPGGVSAIEARESPDVPAGGKHGVLQVLASR